MLKIEFKSPDTYKIKNVKLNGSQMGELCAMASIGEDDERENVKFYYAPGITTWVVLVDGNRIELSNSEVAEIVAFRNTL